MKVKTIYKYQLNITQQQSVMMPRQAEILSAQMQSGVLCIWARVDPAEYQVERNFVIVGTGHTFSESGLRHISTVQSGSLVWHLFEKVS